VEQQHNREMANKGSVGNDDGNVVVRAAIPQYFLFQSKYN